MHRVRALMYVCICASRPLLFLPVLLFFKRPGANRTHVQTDEWSSWQVGCLGVFWCWKNDFGSENNKRSQADGSIVFPFPNCFWGTSFWNHTKMNSTSGNIYKFLVYHAFTMLLYYKTQSVSSCSLERFDVSAEKKTFQTTAAQKNTQRFWAVRIPFWAQPSDWRTQTGPAGGVVSIFWGKWSSWTKPSQRSAVGGQSWALGSWFFFDSFCKAQKAESIELGRPS